MWDTFSEVVHTDLDILMPEKQYHICSADTPWMTQRVKALILKRQKAFSMYRPESIQFKYFRNLSTGREKLVEPGITNQRYKN